MREINKLYDAFGHDQTKWQEAVANSKATYGKLGRVKLVFTLSDNSTVAVSKRQIEKIAKDAVKSSGGKFTAQLKAENESLTGLKKQLVNLREKISQLFGKHSDNQEVNDEGFNEVNLNETSAIKTADISPKKGKNEFETALLPLTELCTRLGISKKVINDFMNKSMNGSFDAALGLALEDCTSKEASVGRDVRQTIRDILSEIDENPNFNQVSSNLRYILNNLGD